MLNWRNFWIFWGGGLAVFIYLVVTGGELFTDAAPQGILDHQAAGTAARVNEIQQSWADAGVLNAAKWSMIGDLIFIGLYTIGGILGGRLIWRDATSPTLKKIGLIAIILYFVFGLTDYIETISQLTQLLWMEGSDLLAGIAAIARPIKIASWIGGTLLMIAMLVWFWRERRA